MFIVYIYIYIMFIVYTRNNMCELDGMAFPNSWLNDHSLTNALNISLGHYVTIPSVRIL